MASNPILFASFCLVMKQLSIDPKTKVHLPVFLDATCSGLQHLAGLMRDSELAKKSKFIRSN
jgi:DNA-directed RNA polymerase